MDSESAIMSDYEGSCSPPCAEDDETSITSDVLHDTTSPKPRYRKWALLDKSRRLKASARERKRRHVLNSALERLRKKVPCLDQNPQKLSKIEVLRQAIGYIADLSQCLESANTSRLAAITALHASPVFLDQAGSMAEYVSNQTQTNFLAPILYRKSMLLDCAQQADRHHGSVGQNATYDECFSPEDHTAPQFTCFDQSPAEEFEYGINDSELDIYLRGFSQ